MNSKKRNVLGFVALSVVSAAMMAGCQQGDGGESNAQHHVGSAKQKPYTLDIDDAGEITALRDTSVIYFIAATTDEKTITATCPIAAGTKIKFKEINRLISTGDDKRVHNKTTGRDEFVAPVYVLPNGRIWLLNATIDDSEVPDSDNISDRCIIGAKKIDAQIVPTAFTGFAPYQTITNRPLPKEEALPHNKVR